MERVSVKEVRQFGVYIKMAIDNAELASADDWNHRYEGDRSGGGVRLVPRLGTAGRMVQGSFVATTCERPPPGMRQQCKSSMSDLGINPK